MKTKKGYGVMLDKEKRFLIEDIPYKSAIMYARDYNDNENNENNENNEKKNK